MKKNVLKYATWSMALCASFACVSCSEEENVEPDPSTQETVITGDVNEDMILKSGQTYYLDGKLQVKAPATLTIEPGAKIIAKYTDNISYILIEQGAKINAVGTAENPIIMTSEKETAGAWGGLHICGKASINVDGGTGKSEIGNATYGGDADDDNSGKLKYIRMENTGQALSADTESNGITFYGVGNATEVSYIQIYNGKDDGIEFFGGTVNVDHAISVNCGDDSFDWTEGWRGEGSYWVAYQQEGASCDCLIEADNNGNNNDATPVSCPKLSKLTLIGNNDAEKNYGVRLRAGTKVILADAQITGKENALRTETAQTETALKDGEATLTNVAISGTLSSKEGIYTNDMFVAAGNLTNQTFNFTDGFVGTTDGRGAVDAANNWTAGWTK